jgi:hypothetical protein
MVFIMSLFLSMMIIFNENGEILASSKSIHIGEVEEEKTLCAAAYFMCRCLEVPDR